MSISLSAALRAAALAAALVVGPAQIQPAFAHEGHDHGAPPPPVSKSLSPRGEAASDAFELVAIPRDGALILHIDRFRTNEPVTAATVEVETADGPKPAQGSGDGVYTLVAPWLAEPGHHDLIVTVTSDGDVDVLTLALDVPAAATSGVAPLASSPTAAAIATITGFAVATRDRLMGGDAAPAATAAGGFLAGVVLMGALRAGRGRAATMALAVTITLVLGVAALAHGDDDHGASKQEASKQEASKHGAALVAPSPTGGPDLAQRLPDGAVFVPKPTQRLLVLRTVVTEKATFRRAVEMPGRIIPDPNASGVAQSSVGGRLSPPASGVFPRLGATVRKGDTLATVTQPIQAVDVSDMRQTQGNLDQQAAILERRVDRFKRLATTGAVAQTQLDDALSELKGLQDRRAALDTIRREPEALIAPVDGVVAQAAAVAGQLAAPGAIVFQIVDPKRLWVEALSFDSVTPAGGAAARLADGRSLALTYQGSGFSDRNQAIPVQFAVVGDTVGLRVGQFVTVLAETESERAGLALPRAAIVRAANGQDLVYAHTAAERFEARPVRVESLDGARVLVAEGVKPGERIVTSGAELLDQVR